MNQKEDWGLIRLVLMDVEEPGSVDLSGYSEEEVDYQKNLIVDSKLAHGDYTWVQDENGKPTIANAWIRSLTPKGHEFLNAARNESVWKKFLVQVGKIGGKIALESGTSLLISIAKNELKLP